MKYAEQYLKEKVRIQPLGELKMVEEDGLERENVFIDGMDTGISIYYCDYSSWLETKISEMKEFNVVLTEVGDDKIAVIKAIAEACNLGRYEVKHMIDNCPLTLKEGLSKTESDKIKSAIEEAGAKVEIFINSECGSQLLI